MTPAIEVKDLRKTYAGGPRGARRVVALDGVSFACAPGEVFALLGPNGACKSSTVRILATLSAPSGGSAQVCGIDVAERPREVRLRIGYVAEASGVDPTATGREQLLGRHEAAPRRRHGPGASAGGALPRRTDHRPRPGEPDGDVGRGARPGAAGAAVAAAHPLPRAGRPAGTAAGDPRRRPSGGGGDAGGAQGQAARRPRLGRAGGPRPGGGGTAGTGRSRRGGGGAGRRDHPIRRGC